ncbi:hypothetical protein AK830_g5415 [Neonectria ditissima]|uniref:Fucose-specific lectin n=1 Tax=Neonectria ditissima TaxID=78410 RepID=A0A0P7BKU7_9HYPO|nr:hypothetical protein AK830_g5415 [Neonectria ditissima]
MSRLKSVSALGLAFAKPALGITGWWTWSPYTLTPHYAYQDPGSGHLVHSACNSNGSATFPTDEPYTFPIKHEAKPATPLAVSGWWDDDLETTIASIFYQTTDDSLVNAYFQCDYETGSYNTTEEGEWKLSESVGDFSVYEKTGLSVVELGDAGGFRLFYHDEDERVNLMAYDDDTDWQLLGPVSRKKPASQSITSIQTNGVNVSVAFPYNDENIAVAQFRENKKDKWILSSFPTPFSNPAPTNRTDSSDMTLESSVAPFSLPSFGSAGARPALTTDENSNLSMFYIGKDRNLHQFLQKGDTWKAVKGSWPEAEDEFAPFALVSAPEANSVWVYYYNSDGDMIELHQDEDGVWEDPRKPTTKNRVTIDDSDDTTDKSDSSSGSNSGSGGNSTDTNATDESEDGGGGLSVGAKAGLGVGISIGAIGLLLVAALFYRRRKITAPSSPKTEDQTRELYGSTAEAMGSYPGYDHTQYQPGGYAIVGSDGILHRPPQELPSVPKYELLGDVHHGGLGQHGQDGVSR